LTFTALWNIARFHRTLQQRRRPHDVGTAATASRYDGRDVAHDRVHALGDLLVGALELVDRLTHRCGARLAVLAGLRLLAQLLRALLDRLALRLAESVGRRLLRHRASSLSFQGSPCLMTTTLRSRACRCFSIPAR